MKFDPVVAHRILREKQERLYMQASTMIWNAMYERVKGNSTYEEERRILSLAEKLNDEAYKMYRVLSYLQERIEEESS